jgi:hypothetical protein
MKQIISLLLIIFVFISCGPKDVQWHEANAKWKGTTTAFNGTAVVNCCVEGDNCAKQGVTVLNFNNLFRSYIDNNNIAGFFANENWQSLFPSLIDHPNLIAYIMANNPKCQFSADGKGFVIFKDANGSFNDPSSLLFAITEKAGLDPCPTEGTQ